MAVNELGSMHAVNDKRLAYRAESRNAVQRLRRSLITKLQDFETETLLALKTRPESTQLDLEVRSEGRKKLWLYSALFLYARDIERDEWERMMRSYEESAKRPYLEEIKTNMSVWRRSSRKTTGDDEVLFTTQEKESESLVGRKLTVKRSKTIRTERQGRTDGKIAAYEALGGALAQQCRMISNEQNFAVELFHASSLDSQDFAEAVAVSPTFRHLHDFSTPKAFDPDRDLARRVVSMTENIFSSWPGEVQSMIDWTIKQDPLYAVGVIAALEGQIAEHEDTNQEWVVQCLGKMHDRMCNLYERFAEDQIRAIEETKVRIKKRKGVIAFIRIFPLFSNTIESMLPPRPLGIRRMIDGTYGTIVKTMFECLKYIAKEAPSLTALPHLASTEAEDKEALNHDILIIENMHYYLEEVNVRKNAVLEEWQERARLELKEHLDSYVLAVIRRPLGKLLDFVESVETLLAQSDEIASRPSHSASVAKKVLAAYDAREIRRGIETLRRRVEKHFGEGEEDLLARVMRGCEERYGQVGERVQTIVQDVYDGEVEMGWRIEDVRGAFRR